MDVILVVWEGSRDSWRGGDLNGSRWREEGKKETNLAISESLFERILQRLFLFARSFLAIIVIPEPYNPVNLHIKCDSIHCSKDVGG